MKLGENDYALFAIKNNFNTGCFVKGLGHVPRTDGVVVYLNGGDDLSTPLSRVEKAGGKILSKKTFLSEEAVISHTSRTPKATKSVCTA